jgi:hypothetical protein
LPKQWKILTVATVAVAMTRRNGHRWTSAKRASAPALGTAYQVWDLLVNRPEDFRIVCLKRDMQEAKAAIEDLAARRNLSESDEALKALLVACELSGGVSEADIRKAAMIGAYWVNGLRRNYPRKDQWEEMRGGEHMGTPGLRLYNLNQPATVTHVIHLDPVTRGGKTQPATLRERRIYKVLADDGTCYQWVELERSSHRFRNLKKGERVLIRSGKVKSHEVHEGVNFTEFDENDVDLLPNQ